MVSIEVKKNFQRGLTITLSKFMLMANISVSHEISKRYPEIALLRRHQAPVERALNEFANYAKALGFTQFEGVAESSNKLQAAFDSIEDPLKRDVMMALCVKPLKRAQYYCSGDETVTVSEMGHYALSVPLYTHFTSPIRRYCDLIVHRLLDGACKRVASNSSANIPLLQTLGKYRIKPNVSLVDELVDQKKTGGDGNDAIHSSIEDVVEEEDEMDRLYNVERVMEIAANCNMRKDSSKNAQDSSQRLFLCAHLTRQASLNPNAEFIEEGIVCKVANRSFDVLIPNCGMDKRCWVEDLVEKDLVFGCEFNELKSILTIHWKPLGGAGSDGGVGGKGGNSLLQQMGSLSLSNNNDSTSDVGSGSGVVQQIQVFEKVKVSLVVQFARSPPEIKIIAVHPLYKGRVGSSEALYTEESSCPAIADDDS